MQSYWSELFGKHWAGNCASTWNRQPTCRALVHRAKSGEGVKKKQLYTAQPAHALPALRFLFFFFITPPCGHSCDCTDEAAARPETSSLWPPSSFVTGTIWSFRGREWKCSESKRGADNRRDWVREAGMRGVKEINKKWWRRWENIWSEPHLLPAPIASPQNKLQRCFQGLAPPFSSRNRWKSSHLTVPPCKRLSLFIQNVKIGKFQYSCACRNVRLFPCFGSFYLTFHFPLKQKKKTRARDNEVHVGDCTSFNETCFFQCRSELTTCLIISSPPTLQNQTGLCRRKKKKIKAYYFFFCQFSISSLF